MHRNLILAVAAALSVGLFLVLFAGVTSSDQSSELDGMGFDDPGLDGPPPSLNCQPQPRCRRRCPPPTLPSIVLHDHIHSCPSLCTHKQQHIFLRLKIA